MSAVHALHLLDDVNFGGVVRGLRMFERPEFAGRVVTETVQVDPRRRLSPRYPGDVILTHFAPSWAMLPFLWSLRARHPRRRLIHVEHSYTGGLEAALVKNRLRFRAMLALALAPFDAVICVSAGQANWLRQAVPTAAGRISYINPWGNVAGLADVPPVVTPPRRPLVLGAYGRFDPVKGFDVLIEAMRRLPPAEFRLILGGFGPEGTRLRALAEGMPNVEFTGRVEDVPGFIARCDAIVIPSRWETFGQVAEEAKGAGRPIVVADVDALPAHVGAAGLIADCRTPEPLAAALARLPDLPLTALGEAGRATLRHAAEDRAAQWLDVLVRAQRAAPRSPAPIRMSPGQIR